MLLWCFAMEIVCCFSAVNYVHFQFCDVQPICYSRCLVTRFLGDLRGFLASYGPNQLGFLVGVHTCEDGYTGGILHA